MSIVEYLKSAKNSIPHPIPYQGSKRNLAPVISLLFPKNIETLYEPFAGSAAMTLFAAQNGLAKRFVLGDSLPQLIELWGEIVASPEDVASKYDQVWSGQLNSDDKYFNSVRDRFNRDGDPVDLLYLIARCVKNAVRFNQHGRFTQSVDKRRLGTRPTKMREAIRRASYLLKDKVEFHCADFSETIKSVSKQDMVYLDPPYQGTSCGPDKRYFAQLESKHLISAIRQLNDRRVPFLLSYDGMTGSFVHGVSLPENLAMKRLLLNAGRSSQATLNGRDDITMESLYISKYIVEQETGRTLFDTI